MRDLGKPELRGLKVYKHIWQKGVTDFADVKGIPKAVRAELSERAVITVLEEHTRLKSDDGTTKFLWRLEDGSHIESVLIPDEHRPSQSAPRYTLCVSTQVGCAMACTFCLTGDLGLKRNLMAAEIASQVHQVQQYIKTDLVGRRLTNVVMMGMGEPLHNFDNVVVALRTMLSEQALNMSHRKITVSTVGLVPKLEKLAQTLPVNIAVSLNATTEAQRREVMPITLRYSMKELMDACRRLPLPSGKRITFEYVMLGGFNDTDADAARLCELMRDVPAKVNLIPYNENPDRDIRRPPPERVRAFQHYLVSRGVHCTVRTTRGLDVSAACGQLGKAVERMAERITPAH
jgi:23S rRNA (adenine2503-C2)-methyltransferase